MKLKSLSVLGLLAATPMASQAAMVEMNETELSDVSGQAMFSGRLFNFSASFDLDPSYYAPNFSVYTAPVLGGVEVNTGFYVGWEIYPSWSVGVTGKYSGTPYYTKSGSANWDPIDFSWSNTRTFRLK